MDNNILGRGSVLGNGGSGSGGGGNGSSGRAAGMYPPAVPSDTRARLDGVDHHTSNNTVGSSNINSSSSGGATSVIDIGDSYLQQQQQQPAYPPHHRSSAVPAGHQKGLTDQQLHEQQQLIQRQLLQQQQHKQEQQGEYAEEEDMEAERDLAEDAQWKRIQQNTFTRWANEHLKSIQQNINSLEADLSDGLRLIALIEILSQKRMPKYNKRPTFRSQKLENVSVALKFLENEGIRIVNIDSSDIVDCKLKLILGLIWTLILHYSISMPMWEGEEDALNGSGPTPKQRLMGWIQSKLPEMPIGNFTNDWTSGKAVGALVDACAPGLCPDWDVWDPKDAVQNASEAMGLADDWLNVRQLIRPEEMVNPKIDEQSMMTYLSQYPNAKLKPGAPLRPKTNPNRVRAYGPGIEPTGPSVGAPANFTVETFSAGNGSVDVTVQTPNGDAQPADVRFNNDKNLSYSVSYVPKTEGPHKVFVKFSGRDIPKSPYTVQVEGHACDASKVSVSGPGLQPDGVCVGRGTFFDINTKGAGRGTPEVVILDPAGHKTSVPAKLRQIADDTWRCEYVSPQVGLHSINVFYAGQPVPNSPFGVRVAPTSDARKVRVGGRGVQSQGVRVGDAGDFQVHTEGAGEGVPEVQIIGPGGVKQPVTVRKVDAHTYQCDYEPKKVGRYMIMVSYGGKEVNKSPFEVNVGPPKESSIVAYGPGLRAGVVGHAAAFVVETNGETGALGFSVAGPSQAEIECKDNGDGSALVKYLPTAPGEYAVHILCDGEDIPRSPFIAHVLPQADFRPELVRASGGGLQPNGVSIGRPAEFTVDTRAAGAAPLEVKVHDVYGVEVPVAVQKQQQKQPEGVQTYVYTPRSNVPHTVEVNYGGVATSGSPHRVYVGAPLDVSKVRASGPWLEAGGKVGTPTHFTVDTREAGDGDLEIHLLNNETGSELPCRVIDNEDGSFAVEVIPPTIGTYTTNMKYGGLKVPLAPTVRVTPVVDVSKIQVDGLEETAPVNSLQQFRVITNGVRKADLAVTITSPSGNQIRAHVIPTAEGYLVNFTPTQVGEYLLGVCFGGTPLSPFPIRLRCLTGSDSGKVRASGAGLTRGMVGQPAEFVIDTRGAGQGGLGVTVEGPCEAAINCRDNGDGTCNVAYLPNEMGDYTINITFDDRHIGGSPFQAFVVPPPNLRKIKVTGIGIQPHGVVMNGATDFTVDLTQLGAAIDPHKLLCSILDPRGNAIPSQLVQGSGDVVKIMYTPFEAGRHTIELLYDNAHVPGSPFVVHVKSGCDPSRCKAYGPGLQAGHTGEPCRFVVETRGAGNGGLSMAVEGPSEAKMTCSDNRDGSCDVEFLPTEPGEYDITIRFADKHIPGSPFRSLVTESVNPGKVRVYGPGIEEGVIRENVPTVFHIDVGAAGPGKVAVKLNNSAGKLVDSGRVEDKGNGVYAVHFVPPSPVGAVLTANVMFADEEVPFSPFVMKVLPQYEADKVLVGGVLEKGAKKCETPASLPARFEIDTRRAGQANTQVTIRDPKGKTLVSRLEKVEEGAYAVTFVPHEIGAHTVDIKYGEAEVAGSPFKVNALQTGDAKKCKLVEKLAKEQPFGNKSRISVDAREAGVGAVTCQIESTEGSDVDIEVIEKEGVFDIVYVLSKPGDYEMDIKFGGKKIPDGLFSIKAIEPPVESKLIAAHQQQDHHDSASSPLQRKVNKVVDQSSFLHEERLHSEQYAMQQQIIEESLTTTSSSSTSTVSAAAAASSVTSAAYQNGHHHSTTDTAKTFRPISLDKLPLPSTGGTVLAEVKMPSGKVDKPRIEDNHDGTVRVQYDPREDGIHELYVKYNGEHVQGSPYKFHVDSISSGHVTAYGPGLTHGVSGDMTQFTISTKGAGAGGLSLAVEGPSKANITYHDNKDGTVGVTYLPTAPGEYKISVRFGDKNINGSPFFAKITGEGRKRNQISVGSCSEVLLPGAITDDDLRTLNASIQTPSGLEEPCFLKRMPSGNIGISFTPREIGDHQVSVKRQGAHISNSPFKVTVGEREVGDAKKVLVSGAALTEGKTHADNTFAVDTRNAGFGGLSLSIEGPSKAEINCTDKDDGTLNISYKPTEPGLYIVNLKFADHHVEGSPFTVKVSGEGSNRQREKIQRQRDAVPVKEVGSPCKLTFKMPGITSFDLGATVTSPSGTTDDAEIQEVKDGLYAVNFVPKELGAHTVSVKYTEMHIPGSPFQYTVGPLHDSGAHLVKAGGGGLERGEVGVPSEFNVWTREAGGGSLAIAIEGPSKADIEFKDRMDGSCDVAYTVSEPGEYRIGMKFNDRHIPDSPHKVYISPAMGDAHLLEVAQFPSGAVQADTPAQFLVRMNGAKGQLDAKVIAPSNAEDDCFIQAIDSEESSVRFYPRESGIHSIHVKFNGVHIVGSPYRIKVGKDVADPACVQAHGDGLHEARTGQKADFLINTCNAGAGSLLMTMDGPAKVSMDCSEVEEGYKVRYTTLLSGLYYMSIKYNNNHIVGSPFKITVAGKDLVETGSQETSSVVVETVAKYSKGARSGNAPVLPNFKSDATKVTSKGMGLKKAFLGKQNQFTINASEAGTGVLFVGLYHPRGPCEEVQTKHTGKNNYTVNYYIRERSDYMLIVMWNENHIPGSPFNVEVSLKNA